ncbi:hypothetical protein [Rhodococcus sp. MEB064]|uniref:hypothetical protein n=1 Tax=Rhodococcus sp. MEB064 TaxID=1587522 RepID=UPI0005AD08F2|nr:hypothetical protein [Rhodococcus sp. MEB064]KIQ18449.1 hypothetical protein RU01_07720 [Rhodococcus sp. MEB064]
MPPTEAEIRAYFDKMPVVAYVVTEDWKIVAVTDRLLDEIGRPRDAVVGADVFETFPDNPADPNADGTAVMRASLKRAFTSGQSEKLPRQRYDAPPAVEGGEFRERYWYPENVPITDSAGRVTAVLHVVVAAHSS